MFTRFQLKNFKGLKEVDLLCERLTVLIGPNSCGKTSVLEGIDLLSQFLSEPKGDSSKVFVGKYHESYIFRRGSKEPIEFHWHSNSPDAFGSFIGEWYPSFSPSEFTKPLNQRTPWHWEIYSQHSPGVPMGSPLFGNAEWNKELQTLGSCQFLRMEPNKLSAAVRSMEGPSRLGADGDGLVRLLAKLKLNDESRLTEIIARVKKVIPALEGVRFDLEDGIRLIMDFNHASSVPGELASEGTLLVLGMITALTIESRPRLLLLDDIDRALHPRAQIVVVSLLRKMLEVIPTLQIIATTHSPYLLNCLEYDEVRVMHRDDEGLVRIGKFAEHPDFEKWKEEFSPGEFWSLVGEDWLPKAAQP